MADEASGRTLRRPEIGDFVVEGEETPLLLRKGVLIAIAIVFAALVAGYLIAVLIFDVSLDVDAEPFREWVEDWGVWGPIVFITVMALSVLFAPVPNAPIFIAAGLVWGPFLGSVYSMAGMMWARPWPLAWPGGSAGATFPGSWEARPRRGSTTFRHKWAAVSSSGPACCPP